VCTQVIFCVHDVDDISNAIVMYNQYIVTPHNNILHGKEIVQADRKRAVIKQREMYMRTSYMRLCLLLGIIFLPLSSYAVDMPDNARPAFIWHDGTYLVLELEGHQYWLTQARHACYCRCGKSFSEPVIYVDKH